MKIVMCGVVVALFCGTVQSGVYHVSPAGNDGNLGTVALPWKSIDKANRTLNPGDTVRIGTGVYTDQINPTRSGVAGNPIVYANVEGAVCSLYVSKSALLLSNKSYVIVQGLRMQMAYAVNDHVVSITGGAHNAILSCRIYGGSTHNNPAWGDWPSIFLMNSSYNRLVGNFFDRQDHDIVNDGLRGDGIAIYGNSRYNIVEANTVVNVSHFGIAVPYGVQGDSYNIVRDNVVYDCHVGIGNTDYSSRCLYEGNRSWSPGEVNTYRGGISCEFSPRKSIIRYNAFYDDSTSVGSVGMNPGSNNGFVTNTAESTPIDNRIYHNVFMGESGTATERFSLYLQNDSPGNFDFGRNVFVNNIIAYPNRRSDSYPISWQDRGKTYATVSDTFRCNLIWRGAPGQIIANWGLQGPVDLHLTLAQLKSRMPGVWAPSNFEASPLWEDSVRTKGERRFDLSSGSPCIDRAIPLTATVRPTTNARAIYVTDASYFHYAWGGSPYDRGDSIVVDGVGAELESIDYQSNILYTTENVTVRSNRGVYVLATYSTVSGYRSRMKGWAPDVGPQEHELGVAMTQAPEAPTLAEFASGSSVSLSAPLEWSNPPSALFYQVQVSTASGFGASMIDESGITGTCYPAGSLGINTQYYWRVRASNPVGDGPWSATRQFVTGSSSGTPGKTGANVVVNGGFENGTGGWEFFCNGSGSFSVGAPAYEGVNAATVVINQPGDNVQLFIAGFELEPCTLYRLRFFARSNSGHDIAMSVHQHWEPYKDYGLRNHVIDADTNWREFVIDFVTWNFTSTVSDARLRFWFTSLASAGDVYQIDEVSLVPIAPAAVVPDLEGIPARFALAQNYPNPFNPSTVIRFSLPSASNVSLKVYDIRGAEVAELVQGTLPPGIHETVFDARTLASGTYLCVLRTDAFVETRKMVLLQ